MFSRPVNWLRKSGCREPLQQDLHVMQPWRIVGQGGAGRASLWPRWLDCARRDGGTCGQRLCASGWNRWGVQEPAFFPDLAQKRTLQVSNRPTRTRGQLHPVGSSGYSLSNNSRSVSKSERQREMLEANKKDGKHRAARDRTRHLSHTCWEPMDFERNPVWWNISCCRNIANHVQYSKLKCLWSKT